VQGAELPMSEGGTWCLCSTLGDEAEGDATPVHRHVEQEEQKGVGLAQPAG